MSTSTHRRRRLSTAVRRISLMGLTRRRGSRWRQAAEETQIQLASDLEAAWDGTFARLDTPHEDRMAAWELWRWVEQVADAYERDVDSGRGRDWPAIAEARCAIYRKVADLVHAEIGGEAPARPEELPRQRRRRRNSNSGNDSYADQIKVKLLPGPTTPVLLWTLPDGGSMTLRELRRAGPIIHAETCIEHPGTSPALERSYLSEEEWERTKTAIGRVAERLGGLSEPAEIARS